MNRRDLLKSSGLGILAAGLSRTLPALSAVEPPAGNASRFTPRSYPPCLDIFWAHGTGLIWQEGETLFYENPRNRFMRFRRSFEINAHPRRAELRLFADTHYIVWVNGIELGRGPGRSAPTWTFFDTYDLSNQLRPGSNTIAILALFQGFGTGGRQSIMQGLLVHLELEHSDGSKQFVVSDRNWRASPAPEFLRPTPRLHATLGCVEVVDQRLAEDGWEHPRFDDASWAKSDYVKPNLSSTPWYHFVPEPLPSPQLVLHTFPRTAIVTSSNSVLPPVETIGEVRPSTMGGSSFSLPIRREAGLPDTSQVITFDLGRVECGYVELDVEGAAGTTIDVLCGEQILDGRIPQPGSARVHATRFILREGRQHLQVRFNWLAFRIVQLWVDTAKPLILHEASLREIVRDLGPAGHFVCDDSFLNRMDAACEHTLRLCAQDGIVDSSSREQQQWIGDGRVTAFTLHHRYAIGTLNRRLIEQIGQGIDWLGTLMPRFPTGNFNVSPIPLYCLHWILSFREYTWFTGDAQLTSDWWRHIQHVMHWFTAFERPEDRLLTRVPHWMYIDVGEGSAGRSPAVGMVNTTLNLHYLAAARFAEEIARAFGDSDASVHYSALAKHLAGSIRAQLWDQATGAYRDSVNAGGKFGTLSEGTNAYSLLLLEEVDAPRAKQIVETIFVRPQANPIKASPFTMNAVFRALSLHRRPEVVLQLLPERFTQQVDSGAMWENWSTHTREAGGLVTAHSLSHAWGAGALAFFVNTIAGINPSAPGWRTVRIEPQPLRLNRAEASVPTPHGSVRSKWEIVANTFNIEVNLPAGITGTLRLPDGPELSLPEGTSRHSCPFMRL